MKKLLLVLVLTFGACAMPIEPATDSDSQYDEEGDLDAKEEAVICYSFPAKAIAFPKDQGSWLGRSAGQTMLTAFRSTCPAHNETQPYFQDDGEINLVRTIGWPVSSCTRTGNDSVYCNQPYTCPPNACLDLPAMWQNESNEPTNWGWSQYSQLLQDGTEIGFNMSSAAPGNHGIWPIVPTQCSNGAPFLQYNPGPNNTTTLACRYPMGAFTLNHF